jgi:hypothetical protein
VLVARPWAGESRPRAPTAPWSLPARSQVWLLSAADRLDSDGNFTHGAGGAAQASARTLTDYLNGTR